MLPTAVLLATQFYLTADLYANASFKTVARELAANPHVCIVAYDEFDRRFDEEETWLRIYCEAIDDSNNRQAKQSIIDEFDWAEEAGYTLDNPDFKCYYLKTPIPKFAMLTEKFLRAMIFRWCNVRIFSSSTR